MGWMLTTLQRVDRGLTHHKTLQDSKNAPGGGFFYLFISSFEVESHSEFSALSIPTTGSKAGSIFPI